MPPMAPKPKVRPTTAPTRPTSTQSSMGSSGRMPQAPEKPPTKTRGHKSRPRTPSPTPTPDLTSEEEFQKVEPTAAAAAAASEEDESEDSEPEGESSADEYEILEAETYLFKMEEDLTPRTKKGQRKYDKLYARQPPVTAAKRVSRAYEGWHTLTEKMAIRIARHEKLQILHETARLVRDQDWQMR